MTTRQYLAALKKLDLLPHSKHTAELLGVSLSAIQRYAAGSDIPEPIALLLKCYMKHGLPR